MVRALGDPCSRGPGPTDYRYQLVARLRSDDVAILMARYPFAAGSTVHSSGLTDTPADVWPALAPFLPASPNWQHSDDYDEAGSETMWRLAFLDPDHAIILVFL
jgi:hypothetical protein